MSVPHPRVRTVEPVPMVLEPTPASAYPDSQGANVRPVSEFCKS